VEKDTAVVKASGRAVAKETKDKNKATCKAMSTGEGKRGHTHDGLLK
jgi:hypothetical protein